MVIKREDADEGFNVESLEDTDCVQSPENNRNSNNIAECISQLNSSCDKKIQVMAPQGSSSDLLEDEFGTFGRHVANQLRCLPIREAVKSQNFIHNYLTEERLKFLEKS